MSSRPAFILVFFFGLMTISYFLTRAKLNPQKTQNIIKLIAGLCLADIIQVLIVAKQPTGHYMIPILTLSTLGIALLYQVWLEHRKSIGASGLYFQIFFGLLFIGLFGSQTLAVAKLDQQFKYRAEVASNYDDTRFNQCARIYFWAAATPSYPLQIGDHIVRQNFSMQLEKTRPKNDFWYEIISEEFRDWNGIRDAKEIAASYPCIYIRGSNPTYMREGLKSQLPAFTFSEACSIPYNPETIFTSGVDCLGKLAK